MNDLRSFEEAIAYLVSRVPGFSEPLADLRDYFGDNLGAHIVTGEFREYVTALFLSHQEGDGREAELRAAFDVVETFAASPVIAVQELSWASFLEQIGGKPELAAAMLPWMGPKSREQLADLDRFWDEVASEAKKRRVEAAASPFEFAVLRLLLTRRTPLYAAYRWLEKDLNAELSMVEFFRIVDGLIERKMVGLWHVELETLTGGPMRAVPSDLVERYAGYPDLDDHSDPFGYSLELGSSADPSKPPDWEIDVDFFAHSFVMTVMPDAVTEGFSRSVVCTRLWRLSRWAGRSWIRECGSRAY